MKARRLIALSLVLLGVVVFAGLSLWRGTVPIVYHGKTVPAWVEQLSTGDAKAKAEAGAAIQAIGPAGCSDLIRILKQRDELWRRALWSIRFKLPTKTRQRIFFRVHEPNAYFTREAAARSLGSLGPAAQAAIPALAAALRDPEGRVGMDAADALGRIGGKAAVPALVRALRDRNERLRWTAAYALGQIGVPALEAIPGLTRSLSDEPVRFFAAYALARMGTSAIPALVATSRKGSDKARAASIRAFALMADPLTGPTIEVMVKTLSSALRDDAPEVRLEAATALVPVGPEAAPAVTNLIACLGDPSEALREKAILALGTIGADAEPALPALRRLENDSPPAIRIAVRKALWGIQGK